MESKRLHELIPRKRTYNFVTEVSVVHTHTLLAPGGFNQYALYQITSIGFVHQTPMDVFVEGIVQSIPEASTNLHLGFIGATRKKLWNTNINHSPFSYLLN
jgi:neutral ceramidase